MVLSGDSQLHFPSTAAFSLLAAGLVDSAGQRVEVGGVPVTWSVVDGGGAVAAVSDTTTFQGVAQAQWTLGPNEGANRVVLSGEGVGSVEFTARAANPGPIVFVSSRRTGSQGSELEGFPGDLYVMNVDGSDVMPLFSPSRGTQFISNPTWSPDGSKILFARAMGRPVGGEIEPLPLGLFVINANATREQQVPAAGFPAYVQFLDDPAWSRFGARIVARLGDVGELVVPPNVTPGQLHMMTSAGTRVRSIDQSITGAYSPAWSPTADLILFSCDSGGFRRICVMDDAGGAFEPLTPGDMDSDPAWSPDGAYILYSRDAENDGGIWIMEADGDNKEQILPGNATSPSWSPDGSSFVVTLDVNGQQDIYFVDLATRQMTNLTNSPFRDREAAWRW